MSTGKQSKDFRSMLSKGLCSQNEYRNSECRQTGIFVGSSAVQKGIGLKIKAKNIATLKAGHLSGYAFCTIHVHVGMPEDAGIGRDGFPYVCTY